MKATVYLTAAEIELLIECLETLQEFDTRKQLEERTEPLKRKLLNAMRQI